jgi:HPt (histidine-containing phosphotransfer) domain-containing protein
MSMTNKNLSSATVENTLDLDVIKKIYEDDSNDFLIGILASFYNEASGYVADINAANNSNDHETIKARLHSLSTMAAMVGGLNFSQHCTVFLEGLDLNKHDSYETNLVIFNTLWLQLVSQIKTIKTREISC